MEVLDAECPSLAMASSGAHSPGSSNRSTSSELSLTPEASVDADTTPSPATPRSSKSSKAEEQSVAKRRSGPRSKTSEWLGVTKYKRTGKWECHVWCSEATLPSKAARTASGDAKSSRKVKRGCQLHVGSFFAAEDAARGYDRAAYKLRGDKASLNFPDTDYSQDWFYKAFNQLDSRSYVCRLRQWAQEVNGPDDSESLRSRSHSWPVAGSPQKHLQQQQQLQLPQPSNTNRQHTGSSSLASAEDTEIEGLLPTRRSSRQGKRRRLPPGWTYGEVSSDHDVELSSDEEGTATPAVNNYKSPVPRWGTKAPTTHPAVKAEPLTQQPLTSLIGAQQGNELLWQQQRPASAATPRGDDAAAGIAEAAPVEARSDSGEFSEANEHFTPPSTSTAASAGTSSSGNYLLDIAKCAMETPTLLGGLLALSASPNAAAKRVPVSGSAQATPLQAPATLKLPATTSKLHPTTPASTQPVHYHMPLNQL
ncbi:hypothetical protein WJX73_005003 [Symbiochloris irregularis]|uniref:AP2/ERF domain-containing protein n=1 Tax=Symbiochloris irregularis TaxID=706552 RepID=A0AAW1PQT5_9CHLO